MNDTKEIVSKDGHLRIEIDGQFEPNNGRTLWSVKVLLDNNDINSQLFDNNWNYINFETNYLKLSDDASNFYYIPAEGQSKLIRKSDAKIIELKYQRASTSRFIGNRFSEKYLIEIFKDEISITNLQNFSNRSLHPEEGEEIY
ncbi:MAG: hypothetical protein OEW75_10200 [Cyclobacteriaceae bacterium]|nr:hypothetical protein [Cyclobacteriaceae bacterium]